MQWFAFDSHKHYTWVLVQDEKRNCPANPRWDMSQPDLIRRAAGSATCPQDTQGTA
jgi:hypothetical protein